MSFVIISGSSRVNSQSSKVAHYIQKTAQEIGIPSELIDLSERKLPFFDDPLWKEGDNWDAAWTKTSHQLKSAQALVIVTPEWNGMAPAPLKNLFHLCSRRELYHKPAMLVGVSASFGGAYPISELRQTSYKNSRICYVPEQVIIRFVKQYLNTEQPENEIDLQIRQKLEYGLKVLAQYMNAFAMVRESGILDPKTFPNGD